jgi:hypothetical protein
VGQAAVDVDASKACIAHDLERMGLHAASTQVLVVDALAKELEWDTLLRQLMAAVGYRSS